MEWKEVLFTLSKQGVIKPADVEELIKLPRIRDEIFFPDYEQFGYISEEMVINQDTNLYTIPLNLISISANRNIFLEFCIISELNDIKRGFFGDRVFIFNEESGWDIMMQMEVRAKRKYNKNLPDMYLFLQSYTGTFEDRARASMQTIKHNYDTYARNIISGEEWDYNA